ncbi:hypothetical protein [Aeromonas phage 4L372D]|uniref:Uncharacterized protein n=2 Tax=Plateaulakevirus TaxID=2843436 RepID=A0A5B9NCF5_9CAUD|nr:hypothetical protein HWC25_gp055 [Aeromonas phage 2L372D]YP_009846627.1 hypothetical protein HWC27_gp079 [Aeromonas phage 4L372D]QDB73969.1 hypothetical protein 2L372D_055 [Aeromonas phage 2L372D]QEG08543.1 hypothetical protein [Aeromonas phage 4L372D]
MTDFDKYKHLYYGNFDTSYTNFPSNLNALSYNVAREQNNKFEKEIYNLIEFIRLWKDRYELFCENFDAYYTKQSMPLWSRDRSERGYVPLPRSEFYIDEFFNMILNKRAKFEIQEYKKDYSMKRDIELRYTQVPDRNIIISGNKFTIIGKDNNYRLDIKMNAALICSLIGAMSNNHVIYQWYSKQSRFKEFIDRMAAYHYFIEFQIDNRYSRILISGGQNYPSLRIDIDGKWLYFILPNEILRVENTLHYNHLDSLFGKDRKEPLTQEDIQLYNIVNEGRKPIMYDFEF